MPIYEYQCQLCGHQLEALQKTSENPLTNCPACKNESLIKLVSAASFQLKGTGWYATDFRTKPNQATANSENQTKEESKDSTTTTSDTSTKDTKSTSGNNGEAA